MYSSQHQRTASNPRAYAAPETSTVGGRRDDAASQGLYNGGDDGYSAYQQQHAGGYGGMSNVGYGYSNGLNLAGYNAANSSPSAPSGSRRTSGPKLATPPTQTSATAGNSSPAARYYPPSQAQGADSAGHHQSPYQPSSAPPQVLSHHHGSMSGQPQTAHPYASQYQHYYDQQNQHHQSSGQWANYPSSTNHGYAQQSVPPRSSTATTSTTTPTVPSSATLGGEAHQHSTHRAPAVNSASSSYDYPSATSYQSWPTHDQSRSANSQQQSAWQHQQATAGRLPQTQGNPASMVPQGAWQGYNNHPAMSQTIPPHHMGSGHAPSQYSWNQQQWGGPGYGYPPAPTQQAQSTHAQPASAGVPVAAPAPAPAPAAVPTAAPVSHKKSKKEKIGDEYKGLGKRPAEPVADVEPEEKKEGKKKKGKKEEEKPVHKAPAKSHLRPPRQAQSAWQLFFTDELNKAKATAAQGNSPGGTPHHAKLNVAQIAKDAGVAYASLNAEQKKYYAQKVQESKEQYAQELAVWQSTLTPEDIKAENVFRAQQRKEGKSRKGNLKDPNAPKKPLSAYFLFLKGIRENDDIRAQVWGEESETTKQSVLAAERWRSLSDEEKKPYLQQAEHDKQEYEAARKVYEEEAAARARGEDIPARAIVVPDVSSVSNDRPKPRKKKEEAKSEVAQSSSVDVKASPSSGEAAPSSDPTFPDFGHADSHHSTNDTPAHVEGGEFEQSMEMDDFHGFTDPLDDMEFTGLESITGAADSHEPQWDELQRLMGSATDDGFEVKPASGTDQTPNPDVKAETETKEPITSSSIDAPVETADLSVAPTFEEAKAETVGFNQNEPVKPETAVVEIASAVEGELSVPSPVLGEARPPSGLPTEEVSELLPADVPQVEDQEVAITSSAEVAPSASQETRSGSVLPSDQPAADGI
ncbi:hypothetical protein IAR55_006517 [Kwoniella newhampshirensis]|uniref:HMG box domain-containing protein n=1 Tax=Kwoniella newhampshirensis TaxID=1651941 RepID=A0AAW0YUC4_9TREE